MKRKKYFIYKTKEICTDKKKLMMKNGMVKMDRTSMEAVQDEKHLIGQFNGTIESQMRHPRESSIEANDIVTAIGHDDRRPTIDGGQNIIDNVLRSISENVIAREQVIDAEIMTSGRHETPDDLDAILHAIEREHLNGVHAGRLVSEVEGDVHFGYLQAIWE